MAPKAKPSLERMKQWFVFQLNFERMKRSHKVAVWRQLYGYSQVANNKTYETEGLVEKMGGKRLTNGVLIIPAANKDAFSEFLDENHIECRVLEMWSDDVHD